MEITSWPTVLQRSTTHEKRTRIGHALGIIYFQYYGWIILMLNCFYYVFCNNTGEVISTSPIIGKANTDIQVAYVCMINVNLWSAMPKLGVASQVVPAHPAHSAQANL